MPIAIKRPSQRIGAIEPDQPGAGAPTFSTPGSLSVGGSPGHMPDYYSLLSSDAMLGQAKGLLGAQSAGDAGSRRASIRSILEHYGGPLQGLQDAYGDVDAATIQRAQANPNSVVQQISRAHNENVGAMRAALASRGMSYSGQSGYEEQRAGQARSLAEYEAANQAMTGIRETGSNFARAEQAREMERLRMMSEAMSRIVASNPATAATPPSFTGTRDDGLTSAFGIPAYRDAQGNLYTVDLNGRPIPMDQAHTVYGNGPWNGQTPDDWFRSGPSWTAPMYDRERTFGHVL